MLKIVKNKGQCKSLEFRNCKYLLYTNDFSIGEMYAKVRLKPIFWYIVAKIKGNKYTV